MISLCLPSECFAALKSKPASKQKPSRQVFEHIEDAPEASKASSLELQRVQLSARGETFQKSETGVWHADVCWSLGPTIANPAHGAVQRIEASQSSSVNQTVQMLNSGMLSCPAGVCVVYSSSHQAYYMLGRSDKKQDCVQIARDTFCVDVQEPIPEMRDMGLSSRGKMSQDFIESEAYNTHAPADRLKPSTSLEVAESKVLVERIVSRVLERQQNMQSVEDFEKDDDGLLGHIRNPCECELTQVLSVPSIEATCGNVPTDRCEDAVCARSTTDRGEWAKTRTLRRSGTTYESQPSESRADARAEAPSCEFAIRGA